MGLFDLFSDDAANDAAAAQRAGLQAGYDQASGLIGKGRDALQSNYAAALAPFLQNLGVAQSGQNAYADAAGLNGAAGNTRARQNFQTSPGYEFQLQQGTENVLRNRARTGDLRSGATNVDLQNLAQGAANQQWGNYLATLQPFLGQSVANAAGAANISTGLGSQLNQSFGNQAGMAYSTQSGIGNANANAELNRYNTSANFLGALMNVAGLATGLGGLSGGLGGLSGLGGGYTPNYQGGANANGMLIYGPGF